MAVQFDDGLAVGDTQLYDVSITKGSGVQTGHGPCCVFRDNVPCFLMYRRGDPAESRLVFAVCFSDPNGKRCDDGDEAEGKQHDSLAELVLADVLHGFKVCLYDSTKWFDCQAKNPCKVRLLLPFAMKLLMNLP